MPQFKDKTGQRFGRLVVVRRSDISLCPPLVTWLCKCDCGTVKNVLGTNLMGNTKSCGCLKKEQDKNLSLDCNLGKILADRYGQGESTTELNKIYNVSSATVAKQARLYGKRIRSVSEANRVYSINEEAFSNLNPTSAYWLGFLLADGNVHKSKSNVRLKLAVKDDLHVKAFKRFLQSDHPLRLINGCTSLEIGSVRLAHSLIQHGIVPNKSFIARPNKNVECNTDFWRGMVDGDGWVYFSKNKRHKMRSPVIGLCGSLGSVTAFKKFLKSHNIESVRIRPHSNIFRLEVFGDEARKLASILYGTNKVALQRKKLVAQEIMTQPLTGFKQGLNKKGAANGF